jgi:hypothetical protein
MRDNLIYRQRRVKKPNNVMKLNESGTRDSASSLDSGNLFVLRDSKNGTDDYPSESQSRF